LERSCLATGQWLAQVNTWNQQYAHDKDALFILNVRAHGAGSASDEDWFYIM